MSKFLLLIIVSLLLLTSCAGFAPKPFVASTGGHVQNTNVVQETDVTSPIPEVVKKAPTLPIPSTTDLSLQAFSIVVDEIPVKEILAAIVDQAKLNADIDPDIEGVVTLSAINQNITQILDRIARQVAIRYEFVGDTLYVSPDRPFFKTYIIDYLDLSRDVESESSVSTQISDTSGGGDNRGGGNNSTTNVRTESKNNFWQSLVSNILAFLQEREKDADGADKNAIALSDKDLTKILEEANLADKDLVQALGEANLGDKALTEVLRDAFAPSKESKASLDLPSTNDVIANPEAGVLMVRATAAKHVEIGRFIETLLNRAKRQVLIQATIVEVRLNKDYQAGIDWRFLDEEGALGFNLISTTLNDSVFGNTVNSVFEITSTNNNQADSTRDGDLTATVRLLDEFGDAQILSSPQIMVLNNQTALLKVVENVVYFEVDSDATVGQSSDVVLISTDTDVRTVNVGIVMALTPQIDANGVVTLNVRPTISSLGTPVSDPNPALTIPNIVPTIRVREMESVLRLVDGQIGVLGGLMTNETVDRDAGLPVLKDISIFGNLFKSQSKQYAKTELVIFLKPIIINNPDVNSDLSNYREYLEKFSERVLIESSEH